MHLAYMSFVAASQACTWYCDSKEIVWLHPVVDILTVVYTNLDIYVIRF